MNRKSFFLPFILTLGFFCGCTSNQKNDSSEFIESNYIQNSELSYKEKTNIPQEIPQNIVLYKNINDGLENITDVLTYNDNVYLFGTSPSYNSYTINVGEKEYTLDCPGTHMSCAFSNNVFYSLFINSESNYSLLLFNINDQSKEIYPLENQELGYDFIPYNNDSIVFFDDEKHTLCKYNYLQQSSAEINIPDAENSVITCDSENNICIFFEENDIKTLNKYDCNNNLIFSVNNFSDMNGNILDIISVDNILSVFVYDPESDKIFENIIDQNNGNTIDRKEHDTVNFKSNDEWKTSDNQTIYFSNNICYDNLCIIKDASGNTIDTIKLLTEKNGFISKTYIDQSGVLYYIEDAYNPLTISENDEDESASHIIHKIDGDTHSSFEIHSNTSTEFTKMFVVSNEKYFIGDSNGDDYFINVYDKNGNETDNINASDIMYIYSYAFCDNCLYISYGNIHDNSCCIKADCTGDNISINSSDTAYPYIFESSDKSRLFCINANGIGNYDPETNECTEILNLQNNDVPEGNLKHYCGDIFLCYSNTECFIVNNKNRTSNKVITMAVPGIDYVISDKIAKFNSENPEYHVNLLKYDSNENTADNINLDIIQDKADIIVSSEFFNVDEYDKDIFEDLDSYLKNDPALSSQSFFENIIDIYREDNKLYEIVPLFKVNCLSGFSDVVPPSETWNYSEFNKYATDINKIELTDYTALNFLYCSLSCQNILSSQVSSISSDSLINTFNIIKKYHIEQTNDNAEMWVSWIDDSVEEKYNDKIVKDIGIPSDSGNGISVTPVLGFSVLSSSHNKDAAWDVISSFLSEDYFAEEHIACQGIPLSRTAYAKILKEANFSESGCKNKMNMIEKADCIQIQPFSKIGSIIDEVYYGLIYDEINPKEAAEKLAKKITIYKSETQK